MTTWILLRGLSRERRHWGTFPGVLRWRTGAESVLALDLPGNGRLNGLASPGSVSAMVEACREQLRAEGASPPYALLALSLGAMVAADWATRHPGECAAVVLINTSTRSFSRWHERLRFRSLPRLWAILRASSAAERERLILALTSRDASEPADALLSNWAAWRTEAPVSPANERRQLWAAMRFRASRSRPKVPVLVLASLGDELVDPACSWRIARAWGVDLRVHASAGHDLPLDDPEWVARQTADWFARVAAPSLPKTH